MSFCKQCVDLPLPWAVNRNKTSANAAFQNTKRNEITACNLTAVLQKRNKCKVKQTTLKTGADPGGEDWGDRPPETCKSNFIHHNFVQFVKQHSRLGHFVVYCFVTAVLWNILHSSYSSEAVMRLFQISLKPPLPHNIGATKDRRKRKYKVRTTHQMELIKDKDTTKYKTAAARHWKLLCEVHGYFCEVQK